MKNELVCRYRSALRPRPLWPETALYGGYKYIELTEDLWIPRTMEYVFLCANSDVNENIRALALAELKDSSRYFRPSAFQQSDYLKLLYTLSRQSAFAISGYSFGLQSILDRLRSCTVYTDADYTTPDRKLVSTEQICRYSSTLITLLPVSSTNLKSLVANWGNIIVYDTDMLIENYTGGLLCP